MGAGRDYLFYPEPYTKFHFILPFPMPQARGATGEEFLAHNMLFPCELLVWGGGEGGVQIGHID